MIEIISITKGVSVKDIRDAQKKHVPIVFIGINQLKEEVEVKVMVTKFHLLEDHNGCYQDYFFFRGDEESVPSRIIEGSAGTIEDNVGHFGLLIIRE